MTNGELERILQFRTNMEKVVIQAQRLQPYLKHIEGSSKRIGEMCQFQSQMQKFAAQVENQRAYFDKITNETRRLYEMGVFDEITRITKTLQEQTRLVHSIAENAKAWEKVNRICFGLGWFPYNEWGPDAGRTILKLHKEGKTDQLNSEICDFYDERVLEISDKWASHDNLDEKRLKIIKQAIVAHLNGYYETAIIVLFSQIEGQIRDELMIKEKINHSNLLKAYRANIKSKKDKKYFKEMYVDIIFLAMLNKLFKRHGYTQKKNIVDFTRHSTLHGYYLGPYDKIQSTKLILLLNFIITTDTWIQ